MWFWRPAHTLKLTKLGIYITSGEEFSDLEDEKLSKALAAVIPAGRGCALHFDVSP